MTGADVAAAKSDVAKALLELKQAQVTAAQNNLKEDTNNPDLKAALAKAEAELQKLRPMHWPIWLKTGSSRAKTSRRHNSL